MRAPYRVAPQESAPEPADPALLQTWVSARACPVCAVAMFGARRHGIQIDACGACGGSWVPSDIARKMVASFVSFGVGADLAAIAERSSATRAVRTDQPRVCPDCALLLTRASVANVEIDVCASDGTWFDRHELCTILDRLLPDLESDAEVVPPEAFGVFGKRTWLPGERLLLASLLELASFGE